MNSEKVASSDFEENTNATKIVNNYTIKEPYWSIIKENWVENIFKIVIFGNTSVFFD